MKLKYDVVIVGGGPAGIVSAISAARKGVKVLLVEQHGYLGGNMTASLVGPMMSFHAGTQQVIQGVPQEIVERLQSEGASVGHVADSIGYTYTVTPFDVEKAKVVFEDMVMEAQAEILYHAILTAVDYKDDIIKSVELFTKSGYITVEADIFLDCTGDGDLFSKTKVPYEVGNPETGHTQACSLMFKLVNVDTDTIRKDFLDNPDMHWWKNMDAARNAERLSVSGYNEKLAAAIENNEISFYRPAVLFFETSNRNEVVVNMSNITYTNPLDVFDLTKAEITGRKQVQEVYAFLKKHINGFQNAFLSVTAPNIGIRESRKMKGVYQLTAEDMIKDQQFSDEVLRYGYPIDIHVNSEEERVERKHFENGHSFGVPYRCFITNEYRNLLVGGRCVSATYEAIGSIRTVPACMAMGHAIGDAAVLALKNNNDVRSIDTDSLRTILKEEKAYIR